MTTVESTPSGYPIAKTELPDFSSEESIIGKTLNCSTSETQHAESNAISLVESAPVTVALSDNPKSFLMLTDDEPSITWWFVIISMALVISSYLKTKPDPKELSAIT